MIQSNKKKRRSFPFSSYSSSSSFFFFFFLVLPRSSSTPQKKVHRNSIEIVIKHLFLFFRRRRRLLLLWIIFIIQLKHKIIITISPAFVDGVFLISQVFPPSAKRRSDQPLEFSFFARKTFVRSKYASCPVVFVGTLWSLTKFYLGVSVSKLNPTGTPLCPGPLRLCCACTGTAGTAVPRRRTVQGRNFLHNVWPLPKTISGTVPREGRLLRPKFGWPFGPSESRTPGTPAWYGANVSRVLPLPRTWSIENGV